MTGLTSRIARIASDATTIAERLGPDWQPDLADPDGLAVRRLARWQDRVAPGDADGFAERLGWIGQDVAAVLPRLGAGSLAVLPEWCAFFAAAMDRANESLPEAQVHPFGPLLGGFVGEAVARLPATYHAAMGADAASTLIHDLLTKLSYLASPALQIEFAAFRGAAPGDGQAQFDAFAAKMAGGGLWDFFAEYAVLARLLSVAALQWTVHVGTLGADFIADRDAIAERFGGAANDRIVAIDPSLSDAHNHGRSVAIVTLSSGRRLAYKPRSVGIEAAWFALLAARDGAAGEFRALTVLDRGTRGWVEIAAHLPCADAAEGAAFYRRAGNLRALLYALEASDCFHENIVAAGGFPVLIDMETLMHPAIRPAGDGVAGAADDILFDSVLRAGLLPVWEAGQNGAIIDISGLGAQARQVTPYLRRRWSAINRDAMTLQHEAIVVESLHHLPLVDGRALRVADHVAPVLAGFRETYIALIARREALLAPGGLLAAMAGETLRMVFHPTRLYGLMLKRLSTPKALRHGVDRSIEFDVLARFYLHVPGKEPYRALLPAELDALERSDIPYFTFGADALDLPVPGGAPITGAFATTAIDRARVRLAHFDDADLALQSEFIRASLVMSDVTVHAAPIVHVIAAPPATDDQMRAAAVVIGETLRDRAIVVGDGVTWIAPQLLPQSTRYELRPLRLDFYGGQAGVALFLAALARVTGNGRDLALAALAPLRAGVLPSLGVLIATGHTIGAATGVGGMVYVLTRCAELLGAHELLEDALAAARLIDVAAIDRDVEHDVMAGVAGAMLGLLTLHVVTGDAAVLKTARRCGDHLLAKALPMPAGIGWPSGRHPPTTGLSHGAAGIALALARLSDRTGDDRYRAAADQALLFERWAFDAAAGNWRDLRGGLDAEPAFMNAWCHGGLGIGLARQAMPGTLSSNHIAAAIALDDPAAIGSKDGLCCGAMARTELLLAAGDAAGARAIAGNVLHRAELRGQFALSGNNSADFFDPSFFQGLSGIGYQLLRLSEPTLLPSALIWA